MALGRRYEPSPYETRCPRCDVSFPVEARTCLHCGGPTGQAVEVFQDEPPSMSELEYEVAAPSTAPDSMSHDHESNAPIEPTSESPFSIGNSIEDSGLGSDEMNDGEFETSERPPTVMGSLFRSLGSFIWVILLIGFSLARSCED